MNEIQKLLLKLPKKERIMFLSLFKQIQADYKKLPGIEPIKGKKKLFRIRVGQYRIIFAINKNAKVKLCDLPEEMRKLILIYKCKKL